MPSICTAVIGGGMIGRVHARAALAAGGELAWVVDAREDVARQLAEDMGVGAYSADWHEAVADPRVNVIVVCVPNYLHGDIVRAAIEVGKHVICEKPLAPTLAEARELADMAKDAGIVTGIGFGNRFYAPVREARARVARGAIGDIRFIQGRYLQDWLSGPAAYNWRVDPHLGGASRAFGDIGTHLADTVEFVTGQRIVELVADTSIAVPVRYEGAEVETFGASTGGGERREVATEDIATVLFHTDQGVSGVFALSQVSVGRKNNLWFEIDGAEASLQFNQERPEELVVGRTEGMTVCLRDPGAFGEDAARYSHFPAGHAQGLQDCFNALARDVYAAIEGRADATIPSFADGLRAAVITDAVLTSARERRWVSVE